MICGIRIWLGVKGVNAHNTNTVTMREDSVYLWNVIMFLH